MHASLSLSVAQCGILDPRMQRAGSKPTNRSAFESLAVLVPAEKELDARKKVGSSAPTLLPHTYQTCRSEFEPPSTIVQPSATSRMTGSWPTIDPPFNQDDQHSARASFGNFHAYSRVYSTPVFPGNLTTNRLELRIPVPYSINQIMPICFPVQTKSPNQLPGCCCCCCCFLQANLLPP